MEGKLYYHYLSFKAGVQFYNKSNTQRFAFWGGSMYVNNRQTFSSTVDIEEISPEVAQIIGNVASYSGDVTPIHPWNVIAGASWTLKNHHRIYCEGGLFQRKQFSMGYTFQW